MFESRKRHHHFPEEKQKDKADGASRSEVGFRAFQGTFSREPVLTHTPPFGWSTGWVFSLQIKQLKDGFGRSLDGRPTKRTVGNTSRSDDVELGPAWVAVYSFR